MSFMQEVRRTLLEFLIVGAATLGLGLLANGLNEDGLSLGKNYFGVVLKPASETDSAPAENQAQPDQAPAEDDVIATVSARLRETGLQPIDHDSVVELFEHPDREAGLIVFVDARNDEHYRAGHIPGAYQFDHFHLDRYVNDVMPVLETAEKVVVYCYGKDCTDSEITATYLINFGVDRKLVSIYVGGIQSWCEAGFQVETGERDSGALQECER